MNKNCKICHVNQDVSCFRKNRNTCKSCENEKSKQYRNENRAEVLFREREYAKKKRKENPDKTREIDKKSKLKNKEKVKQRKLKYYLENKDKIHEYQNNNRNTRRKIDPAFRMRELISTIIRKIIKQNNSSKYGQSVKDNLPYSFTELKDHIEKQFELWMTWDNQGKYDPKTWKDNDTSTWTWQIDHIYPQSKLPYTSMKDDNFKKCWALSNLRPLSSKQNVLEGNRRDHV